MSGLKQLRNRIKSIKSTKKITKAMQVVSAAKLRKIKDQAENLDSYSSVLAKIMDDIRKNINFMDLSASELDFLSEKNEELPYLLVVMTSERGLCGSFNSQIIKAVKRDIAKFELEKIKVKLLIIGKKGYDALKVEYSSHIEEYHHLTKEDFLPLVPQVKQRIISLITQKQVSRCYLYYNKFKNALTQVMTRAQVLPAEYVTINKEKESTEALSSNYEYEGEGLVSILINLYVIGMLKYAFLQNKASEEAARMTAMDNATRNATELTNELTLKLNRSRQAIITTELTEIISGAEAL